MPRDELTLRPATSQDLPVLAEVYLRARVAAEPSMPPLAHTHDEVRAHMTGWATGERDLWLAEDDEVVGYASIRGGFLDSLYVLPEHHGTGVGSALLDVVKARCPDGFELWVFESNRPARDFYSRRGFVELERTDGSDNEERSPDLKLAWPGPDPVAYFRRQIDRIDDELAVQLGRRNALTAAVQEHKEVPGHAGRDPDRERQIAVRMSTHAPGLGPDAVARIMHIVIAESLDAWESHRA